MGVLLDVKDTKCHYSNNYIRVSPKICNFQGLACYSPFVVSYILITLFDDDSIITNVRCYCVRRWLDSLPRHSAI